MTSTKQKITNHIILDLSNDTVLSLIDELKECGIPEKNFIQQKNQICLYVRNTPLFATLTETVIYQETTLTYSLYYQNILLATTKINVMNDTCSTRVNPDIFLPSTLSSVPVPIMQSKDYLRLEKKFYDAFWKKDQQEMIKLEIERSLDTPENVMVFNEHAALRFKDCNTMLDSKTRKTSFAGYRNQFKSNEQQLITKSTLLMEYMPWFTPENQLLAQMVGLGLLRTITDGYSYLPDQPLHGFFIEPEHKKACIDNFITYARSAYESRDKSGEWHENEERRFKSFIDFAFENDLAREMDNEQRKHFFETIYLLAGYDLSSKKTFMLFNPDNIIDRSIFNEILEANIDGKKNRPKRSGLICQQNLKSSTPAELNHLRKLLSYDKIQLLNSWGYLDKPRVDENNSPDFLLPEKLVTRVSLISYLSSHYNIDWEKWLKASFAPHAEVKLFMMEFGAAGIEFVVALKHNNYLSVSSDQKSHVYFNMDGGGLHLNQPDISFCVRGPNCNGGREGYYLSAESSVLWIKINNLQALEKDLHQKWQEISSNFRTGIEKIFKQGIDCNRGTKQCISWLNNKSDLLQQMSSLAKHWNIDYSWEEEYFNEPVSLMPALNRIGLHALPERVNTEILEENKIVSNNSKK